MNNKSSLGFVKTLLYRCTLMQQAPPRARSHAWHMQPELSSPFCPPYPKAVLETMLQTAVVCPAFKQHGMEPHVWSRVSNNHKKPTLEKLLSQFTNHKWNFTASNDEIILSIIQCQLASHWGFQIWVLFPSSLYWMATNSGVKWIPLRAIQHSFLECRHMVTPKQDSVVRRSTRFIPQRRPITPYTSHDLFEWKAPSEK